MGFQLKPSRSKYRASPITVDGERFDSKAEYARWCELKVLERLGEIGNLQRQVKIDLHANRQDVKRLLGRYIADFAYREIRTNRLVLEDEKGCDTALSRWKRKHVEAEYGIPVTVTRRSR